MDTDDGKCDLNGIDNLVFEIFVSKFRTHPSESQYKSRWESGQSCRLRGRLGRSLGFLLSSPLSTN